MKNIIPHYLLPLFVSIFLNMSVSAQINVVSTNGYIVDINVTPIGIDAASNSCKWGYNYTVKLNYHVSFVGSNKPSSLYTLQGSVGCGSSTSFFDLPNNGGNGVVSSATAWRSLSDCKTASPA
ncbi:MAG: hypothetical protein ABUT20_50460, partial [Bacteroidota bacterium]